MKIEKFIVKDRDDGNSCQITWKGLNDYGAKIDWNFGGTISLEELQWLRDAIDAYLVKKEKKAAKKTKSK